MIVEDQRLVDWERKAAFETLKDLAIDDLERLRLTAIIEFQYGSLPNALEALCCFLENIDGDVAAEARGMFTRSQQIQGFSRLCTCPPRYGFKRRYLMNGVNCYCLICPP